MCIYSLLCGDETCACVSTHCFVVMRHARVYVLTAFWCEEVDGLAGRAGVVGVHDGHLGPQGRVGGQVQHGHPHVRPVALARGQHEVHLLLLVAALH